MASSRRRRGDSSRRNEARNNVIAAVDYERLASTTRTGRAFHDNTYVWGNPSTYCDCNPQNTAGLDNVFADALDTNEMIDASSVGQEISASVDREGERQNELHVNEKCSRYSVGVDATVGQSLRPPIGNSECLCPCPAYSAEHGWDAITRAYVAEYLDRVSDAEFELLERALTPQHKREADSGQSVCSHGDERGCERRSRADFEPSHCQRRERRHSSIPRPVRRAPSTERHQSARDHRRPLENRGWLSSCRQRVQSDGQSHIPRPLSAATRPCSPDVHVSQCSSQKSHPEDDVRPKIPHIIKYFIHRREVTDD